MQKEKIENKNSSDKTPPKSIEARSHVDYLSKIVVLAFCILMFAILVILVVKKHTNSTNVRVMRHVRSFSKPSEIRIFDDIKINTDLLDAKARNYVNSHAYNDPVTYFLKRSIKEGDTIVEVNNEIGMQTLLLLKLCGLSGRVYSFNPNTSYIHSLLVIAKSNMLQTRLKIKNLAISNDKFKGVIINEANAPIEAAKLFNLNEGDAFSKNALREIVNVSSLDRELKDLQNINCLKLSVSPKDGIEILKGAKNFILRNPYAYIILNYEVQILNELNATLASLFGKFAIYKLSKEGELEEVSAEDLQKLSSQTIVIKSFN